MTKKSVSASARYFDALAGRWDSLMTPDQATQAVIRDSLAALALSPGEAVLDAGCGTGVLFPFLLPLVGEGGNIIGVDVASAMIEAARRKFNLPRIKLVVSDIESFLMRRGGPGLNAVACFQAFPHFENKQHVFEVFFSRLVPGGRFAVFQAASAAEVNAFHATLDAPVNAHRLPPVAEAASYARQAGFAIREARDEPGLFRLVGEKKQTA